MKRSKNTDAVARTMRQVMPAPIPRVKAFFKDTPARCNFSQGVPWFGPPPEAVAAVCRQLAAGSGHSYGPVAGNEPLRELLQLHVQRYGISAISAQRMMVTPGSNQAFFMALRLIADAGDEVIFFTPYYFNHIMAAQMLGIVPVFAPCDSQFHIIPEAVQPLIGSKTRAIVLVSPCNPTGAMQSRETIAALAQLAARHGLYLICDEAYIDFCWDAPHMSALTLDYERSIGLFSFSKSFGMSGWRLGFVALPDELLAGAVNAADTMHICAPVAAQMLGVEALQNDHDYAQQFGPDMRRARDILLQQLQSLTEKGCVAPAFSEGGFYVWLVCLSERVKNGWELTEKLATQYDIAVLPGEAFGWTGQPALRISYGNIRAEKMQAAASQLAEALILLCN